MKLESKRHDEYELACYLILSNLSYLLAQPPANTVAVVTAQPRRKYNLSLRVIDIASIICHYQNITLTVVFKIKNR